MSSILKALRKLEEEKAAIGEGGVDIARDILKRSAEKKEGNRFWPILSAVLFLLLFGSGVFFWTEYQTVPVHLEQSVTSTPGEPAIKLSGQTSSSEQINSKTEKVQPRVHVPIIKQPEKISVLPTIQSEPAALRPSGAPFLKLTGIAYREKAEERIAIINDLPVMQGTVIEGVQIVEILPDRVKFSWKNKIFEQLIENEKN